MNRTKPNPLPDHTSSEELATRFNTDSVTSFNWNWKTYAKALRRRPAIMHFAFDGQKDVTQQFLCFDEVSEADIAQLIGKAPDKTCELDPMPTSLVKACVTELVPIVVRIVNLSITTSTVLAQYTTAIVRPLINNNYKAWMQRVPKSYRPFSNLSFIRQLIERVASKQVWAHLAESALREKLKSA